MDPLLLIAELERFALPPRRKNVMRLLIIWQSELGVDQLRLDGRCGALSDLTGAEGAVLSRNHARSELDALERDGFILITEEPGALLVRIVTDAMFWRCSQLQDRTMWIARINALRHRNGLQQLAFPPEQFTPNEPTLAETIAGRLPGPVRTAGALPVAPTDPLRPANTTCSPVSCNGKMSYSPISHNGNDSHNRNRKSLISNDGTARANSNSNSNNKEHIIRNSNSKGTFPIRGNPQPDQPSWRNDGYILEKLRLVPAIERELQEGVTRSSTDFEQLFHLNPDRARQLICSAAALPPQQANGRPSNPCRWFNKTVSDQLWKASLP